jgi:hypothetical protein
VVSVTRRKETVLRAREAIVHRAAEPLIGDFVIAEPLIGDLVIAAHLREAGPARHVVADRRTERAAEVLPVEIATGRERTERTIPSGRWMD